MDFLVVVACVAFFLLVRWTLHEGMFVGRSQYVMGAIGLGALLFAAFAVTYRVMGRLGISAKWVKIVETVFGVLGAVLFLYVFLATLPDG